MGQEVTPKITGIEALAATTRTVLNIAVVAVDAVPFGGWITKFVEVPNMIVLGINAVLRTDIPNLTPDVGPTAIAGGLVLGGMDTISGEAFPFPSAAIIHGGQILHDLPKIHDYVEHTPSFARLAPFTGALSNLAGRVIKGSKLEQTEN